MGDGASFIPTAYDWLREYDGAKESTRERYGAAFDALFRRERKNLKGQVVSQTGKFTRTKSKSGKVTFTDVLGNFPLEQVGVVLQQYRVICKAEGLHESFNKCRTALRSFMGSYYSNRHPLYFSVVDVEPLPAISKNPGRNWSVRDFRQACLLMPIAIGAQFWMMALTGAGIEELNAGISVEGKGIRIKGAKMERRITPSDTRRNRLVPMVEKLVPVVIQEKRLRGHIKSANETMKIGDARKCYAFWCLEAGIPYDRRQSYMGHLRKSMTDRYSVARFNEILAADAVLLRRYIRDQLQDNTRGPTPAIEKPKRAKKSAA